MQTLDFSFLYPILLFLIMCLMGLTIVIHKLWVRFILQKRSANFSGHDSKYTSKAKNEDEKQGLMPKNFWIQWSYSFFSIFLVVFVIRSFIIESYQIPSGSMIPTLKIGDFVLVSKSHYRVHLPFLDTTIVNISKIKRGDVVVFDYPVNERINFIKRVIGLPGDRISFDGKQLTINGNRVVQEMQRVDDNLEYYLSDLGDKKIITQYNRHAEHGGNVQEWIVPEDSYFMMGDNRDNSLDSRYWGFVKKEKIAGKALFVWMNWKKTFSFPNFFVARKVN